MSANLDSVPAPKPATLVDKLERAREIIDCYNIGVPFAPAHVAELTELSGVILRGAWRQKNPKFPNDRRHLHVLAYDWVDPQQWSWRTAIQIAHSRDPVAARVARDRQKVLLALRQAINTDLRDFRDAQAVQLCAKCESPDDLTTDHLVPPFSLIAAQFMQLHPVIELREVQGASDAIRSDELEAEWIAFHAARATYQLLCRSCNSRKGAR